MAHYNKYTVMYKVFVDYCMGVVVCLQVFKIRLRSLFIWSGRPACAPVCEGIGRRDLTNLYNPITNNSLKLDY